MSGTSTSVSPCIMGGGVRGGVRPPRTGASTTERPSSFMEASWKLFSEGVVGEGGKTTDTEAVLVELAELARLGCCNGGGACSSWLGFLEADMVLAVGDGGGEAHSLRCLSFRRIGRIIPGDMAAGS